MLPSFPSKSSSDLTVRPRVDTGTTLIIAPPGDAEKFWSQVPGASRWDQAEGYYTFVRPRSSQFLPHVSVHLLTLSLSGCPSRASVQPCSQIPKLSFSFDNGRKWAVRPVDMNLGRISSHSQYCVGAVAGVDIGLGDSTWILGCSFLKVRDSSPSRHHRVSEGLTIVLICRTSTLSSILPMAIKSDSQLPSKEPFAPLDRHSFLYHSSCLQTPAYRMSHSPP